MPFWQNTKFTFQSGVKYVLLSSYSFTLDIKDENFRVPKLRLQGSGKHRCVNKHMITFLENSFFYKNNNKANNII